MTEGASEQSRGVGGISYRAAAWLAWSLCEVSLVLIAGTMVFLVLNGGTVQDWVFLGGMVSTAIVGGLVASRRPGNPVGWFFVVSAVSLALQVLTSEYAQYGLITNPGSIPAARIMAWPQTWLWVPGIVLVLIFLPLYFPNGRLLSRRWRRVVWLAVALCVLAAVNTAFLRKVADVNTGIENPLAIEVPASAISLIETVPDGLLTAVAVVSATSLVVRFLRSRGEERQQMKWLAYAVALMPILIILGYLTPLLDLATGLVFAAIPIAVGVAVLRYRLYEIDLIINRTLVYGSLTVLLAATYFGGVVGLQYVFRALTGQGSTLAVVASTLAIAALFNPLRRRIQAFVDKRFYRSKYDARKTLEAFSAKLRDETDLEALNDDLVGVVRETMQPSHASLWLRPETSAKGEQEE
jgi:hypothetical protein